MILQHASRVVWMGHLVCGFDWSEVEKYRPDEVWWMPDGTFSGLPTGREAEGLARTQRRTRPKERPRPVWRRRWARPEVEMARANEPRTIARSLLVLGGARSGKSAYAQRLAEAHGPERLYLATATRGR